MCYRFDLGDYFLNLRHFCYFYICKMGVKGVHFIGQELDEDLKR